MVTFMITLIKMPDLRWQVLLVYAGLLWEYGSWSNKQDYNRLYRASWRGVSLPGKVPDTVTIEHQVENVWEMLWSIVSMK